MIGSWLAHDANGFLQIVWRIVLGIVFLAGIWWTSVWFASPNATMGALSAQGVITIGLVVNAAALFGLIRSIRISLEEGRIRNLIKTMRTVAGFRHEGRIVDICKVATLSPIGCAYLYKPYIHGEEIPVT